jgi:hypothetical protein
MHLLQQKLTAAAASCTTVAASDKDKDGMPRLQENSIQSNLQLPSLDAPIAELLAKYLDELKTLKGGIADKEHDLAELARERSNWQVCTQTCTTERGGGLSDAATV